MVSFPGHALDSPWGEHRAYRPVPSAAGSYARSSGMTRPRMGRAGGLNQSVTSGGRFYLAEKLAAYTAPMTALAEIGIDDPRRPDVRALLERHLVLMLSASPPEHSFALNVDGLLDPAITFCSLRADGELLGVGALKQLDAGHAEIKSMHTAQAARGRGVGRAMLNHLLGLARSRGYQRVSLETGTMAEFAPARALYKSAGFVACEPFAGYQPSEDNCFMTLALDAAAP
jgi:putative acetyltransferase